MMVKTPMRTESEQGKKGRSHPFALGKVNLLVALLGLLALVGAYWVGLLPPFLPEALALLILTLSLLTAASRAWHARRGGLEYGLLRHPFRRELRPYLLPLSAAVPQPLAVLGAVWCSPPGGHVRARSGPSRVALLAAPAGANPLPTARDRARRRGAGDGRPCARASPPRAGRYQRPGGHRHHLPSHPPGAHLYPACRPGCHRP